MTKENSLFGYGITTKALASHLDNVVFYDDNTQEVTVDKDGYTIMPSKYFNPKKSQLQIPSPGIAPSNPLIQKAPHLISEYDFFANTKAMQIWISGTNGKTTTTQMTQHLLAQYGAVAGGNIGVPLGKLPQDAKIWILETRSFTLHYTQHATPSFYLLLPLSPDHLSWHGSMQEYVAAKLKPLSMMKKEDYALIPKKYANTPTKATLYTYEDEDDLANFLQIDKEKVKFKGAFLVDALLAMGVEKLLFQTISYEKINSFTLDANRQEEIYDSQNRLWVNDTKATNLDATIAAVKRYEDRFIHLILGGDDKGVDLTPLFEFLAEKKLCIYAIGTNKNRLITLAKQYNIPCVLSHNLEDAVAQIEKKLTKKEVALLSPAAASLDQFRSYAHRGDVFKNSIKFTSF
jgi:UDP-N-acetylmuramoylalanine--D-glutamate ligase